MVSNLRVNSMWIPQTNVSACQRSKGLRYFQRVATATVGARCESSFGFVSQEMTLDELNCSEFLEARPSSERRWWV